MLEPKKIIKAVYCKVENLPEEATKIRICNNSCPKPVRMTRSGGVCLLEIIFSNLNMGKINYKLRRAKSIISLYL